MKRFVTVLSAFSFIALGVLAGGCNLFSSSPNSASAKPAFEPDSVKGDTTFYSYRVRDTGTVWRFATMGAYWWYYWTGCEKPWKHVLPGLSLWLTDTTSITMSRAEKLIADNGDSVIFHGIVGSGSEHEPRRAAYAIWRGGVPASQYPLDASAPLLEWVWSYDQHSDIIAEIVVITDLCYYDF